MKNLLDLHLDPRRPVIPLLPSGRLLNIGLYWHNNNKKMLLTSRGTDEKRNTLWSDVKCWHWRVKAGAQGEEVEHRALELQPVSAFLPLGCTEQSLFRAGNHPSGLSKSQEVSVTLRLLLILFLIIGLGGHL